MAAIFGLGNTELIIILVVVLILFGPKRLPQLGKSLGKTMRSIREGADGKGEDDEDEDEVAATPKPKAPEAEKAAPKAKEKATSDNADLEDEEA
jgi:sec-independent protein translocase protein TatA